MDIKRGKSLFCYFHLKKFFLSILFFLSLVLFSCDEYSQLIPKNQFIKYYGKKGYGELAFSEQLPDGGYIMVGTSENEVSRLNQITVYRTDEYGIDLYKGVFGSTAQIEGRACKRTKNGDFIFIGKYINPDNSTDCYLVKTNDKLEMIWELKVANQLGDEEPQSLALLNDGSYFVLGIANLNGNREAFSMIISAEGKILTQPSHYGVKLSNFDVGKTVIVRNNGRLTWCSSGLGTSELDSSTSDLRLIFSTPEGVPDVGDFNFGGLGNDIAADIQKAPGGYILLGTKEGKGNRGSKIYVVKTNETGKMEWEKLLGPDRSASGSLVNQKGLSVCTTSDGGYIIAGVTDNGTSQLQEGQNIYLQKINSWGDFEWEEIIGGKGNDEVVSVRETADGGFIIGATITLGGDPTMCLIKTNSRGKTDG